MSEETERLKKRATKFALDVCAILSLLPREEPGPTIRRQIAKSSTGMAMNYCASCRARSHAEYTAKIGVVAEEADETQGWLEFIRDGKITVIRNLTSLISESTELSAIFSASAGTARENERAKRQHRRTNRTLDDEEV